MAVLPNRQRRGIGSQLVRQGLRGCAEAGHRVVVVVGHPDSYPPLRLFGGTGPPAEGPFSGPAFMALELVQGALDGVVGEVRYPPPFGCERPGWERAHPGPAGADGA
jgi:putative acetyltransferase